ncbi:hypothetical protein ROS217_02020 [Roseovarius sp. 217]|nr:hypothetical protein ROS217_02020 [Roseovarius sp. 217]
MFMTQDNAIFSASCGYFDMLRPLGTSPRHVATLASAGQAFIDGAKTMPSMAKQGW